MQQPPGAGEVTAGSDPLSKAADRHRSSASHPARRRPTKVLVQLAEDNTATVWPDCCRSVSAATSASSTDPFCGGPQLIERGPQLAEVVDVDRDQIQARRGAPRPTRPRPADRAWGPTSASIFDSIRGRRPGNRVPADPQASLLQQQLGAVPGGGELLAHRHRAPAPPAACRYTTPWDRPAARRPGPAGAGFAGRNGKTACWSANPWPSAAANDSRVVRVAFGVVTNAAVEAMLRLRVVAPTAATPITCS